MIMTFAKTQMISEFDVHCSSGRAGPGGVCLSETLGVSVCIITATLGQLP